MIVAPRCHTYNSYNVILFKKMQHDGKLHMDIATKPHNVNMLFTRDNVREAHPLRIKV